MIPQGDVFIYIDVSVSYCTCTRVWCISLAGLMFRWWKLYPKYRHKFNNFICVAECRLCLTPGVLRCVFCSSDFSVLSCLHLEFIPILTFSAGSHVRFFKIMCAKITKLTVNSILFDSFKGFVK